MSVWTLTIKRLSDVSLLKFRFRKWPKNTALAYIDSRDCMRILDDVVWAENRQRDHKEHNWCVYAWVWIFVNEQRVWKWDAWEKTTIAAHKWWASDSFKRACVARGIGRVLYTLPRLYAQQWREWDFTTNVRRHYEDVLMWWYEAHGIKAEDAHGWQYDSVDEDVWEEGDGSETPLWKEVVDRMDDIKKLETYWKDNQWLWAAFDEYVLAHKKKLKWVE